jgi:predicted O-linked N-acetylglucosamine transferase (SPINDLY family)
VSTIALNLISKAHRARDSANWQLASELYQQALTITPQSAETISNLALCLVGQGKYRQAIDACLAALKLRPNLWQSWVLMARSQRALGLIDDADHSYQSALRLEPNNPSAVLGRADLALNIYGDPLAASALVEPLFANTEFAMDAHLTQLLASLYDRNPSVSATQLTQSVMAFSKEHLQLSSSHEALQSANYNRADLKKKALLGSSRPRVGIISNKFCASPVYFLTIAGWRHVSKGSDIVVLNRGHQHDWATDLFKELACEWHDLQHMPALLLAKTIKALEIDVLYDLGGWMDPIGLQALSFRPAAQQFKWVGGQSITTGLTCFDGWIGDLWQSPQNLQQLYTEPLIQIPNGYAQYTPPDYLPKRQQKKSSTPCIFSNPAKVSRVFLAHLKKIPGKKVFIHKQYQFARTQKRITDVLGNDAEFIFPANHQEALSALNQHAMMIDTFPYTSGLTAYEADALGTTVKVARVGQLFCERHTANYFNRAKI